MPLLIVVHADKNDGENGQLAVNYLNTALHLSGINDFRIVPYLMPMKEGYIGYLVDAAIADTDMGRGEVTKAAKKILKQNPKADLAISFRCAVVVDSKAPGVKVECAAVVMIARGASQYVGLYPAIEEDFVGNLVELPYGSSRSTVQGNKTFESISPIGTPDVLVKAIQSALAAYRKYPPPKRAP